MSKRNTGISVRQLSTAVQMLRCCFCTAVSTEDQHHIILFVTTHHPSDESSVLVPLTTPHHNGMLGV
eukprot:scaffold24136_cov23-Cyclotella_meneghiniana.AAC.1